jgi:ribonuclease BN (tRNA processing enzyme)
MNHPVETFGYRLEHGGRSVAYSGDTGESEALIGLAREADLLLCEASLLDSPDLPADLHLTARQAARHAAQAGAGQLVLTHLVPWNDQALTLEEASQVPLDGPVSLAASGRVIDLG